MPRNSVAKPASRQTATTTKTAGKSSGAAATSRRTNGAAQKSDETMLNELFLDELKDIYWAEKHLTKALPKMRKAATSQELAAAFENHLAETEGQIKRIESVFELLGMAAKAKKCDAMEGLVKEAQSLMEELPKGSMVRDAGMIIAAQKVEHYEIAAYGSLVQLAKTMGKNNIANLLLATLNEEKNADQLLTQLAESGINVGAESEENE
ncbi:YciE/YciF ferroxidase family protein [Flavisolibacter nicotianae]|uniref:YciE/YciF ferroxidase family protein n=1 Tax=Flavisolibacter nicotianae TaxID=2364882 RepID=UPI000EAD876C|nr:ferritin-like domain-containing protein [Flavisolibacter nicotianae]